MASIDPVAVDILRQATVDGDRIVLPDVQLDRTQYVAVDKALKALGGKWNRSAKAHVFANGVDLADRLASALDDGKVDKLGFFPTPSTVVDRLMALAAVSPHHSVLEPSAGEGAIADRLREIVPASQLVLVEIQPHNAAVLKAKGYSVVVGDFMRTPMLPTFDRVVMNPPFERQQDIDHVTRAYELLAPGGRLVSVMSASVAQRADRKTATLTGLVNETGSVVDLPAGAFKESGTGVNSIVVVLDKPIVLEKAA